MIQHLDLLDEVFEGLSVHVSLSKLLDSNFCAHPFGFEDVTVSASSNEVCFGVDFQFFEIDVEVKTVFFERCDESCFLA